MDKFVRLSVAVGAAVLATGVLMIAFPPTHAWAFGDDAAGVAAASDTSETRDVGTFDRVELSGPFSATVTAGEPSHFRISGPPDAVRSVTATVRDGTLVVGMTQTFHGGRGVTLAIATPHLRGFSNSGAGKSAISGIAGDDFDVTLSGAASIVASGRAKRETVTLNGVGKIDATALEGGDVTVDNDGVGSVRVNASGRLVMNVGGVGEIRYTGNPAHVESNVSGLGRTGRV